MSYFIEPLIYFFHNFISILFSKFTISQIYFILIVIFLLFLPGYFLLQSIFKREQFSFLEKFILAIPLGFTLTTLAMIISGRFGMPFNKTNLWILFSVINFFLITFSFFRQRKDQTETENKLFNFSKKQTILISLLIFLTISIKGFYLVSAIFPTATDLAHHMFWVQKIIITEKLPEYQEMEIEYNENKEPYLTEPKNIADFIVGEHLIFSAIAILSGKEVVSSFTSLILFIINLNAILMIFVLTLRLFEKYKFAIWVAIFTLFFMGPLYAISSAQAKFVSGGLIGNVTGDLFIPAIFYFIYRAFSSKNSAMLMLAICLVAGISYTHHLSTFIFLFGMAFSSVVLFFMQVDLEQLFDDFLKLKSLIIFVIISVLVFLADHFLRKINLSWKILLLISFFCDLIILSILQENIKNWILDVFKNVVKLPVFVLISCFLFMFLVFYVPSYLNKEAIGSATGTPEKSTRTGIPFNELMYMSGEARFILGIVGLLTMILLALLIKNKKTSQYFNLISPVNLYGLAVSIGWSSAILIMSLAPHLLKVNIISSRISNYVITPLTILAGFAIVWFFDILHQRRTDKTYLPKTFISIFFTLIFLFVLTNGMRDNSSSLKSSTNFKEATQTYYASKYVSEKINENDWMVKDHNYIEGDAWIKIFFARDYNMPLSRAFLQRYETNPSREDCTLKMISQPNSPEGKQCYENLNVSVVMIHTNHDSSQFNNSDNFYRVYQNNEVSIYFRKK